MRRTDDRQDNQILLIGTLPVCIVVVVWTSLVVDDTFLSAAILKWTDNSPYLH